MPSSARHHITVEGPLQYPGGKDGLYRASCSQGDYLSGFSSESEVTKYGKQHADAKNNAPCASTDPDTGLRCTLGTVEHTVHECTIEWRDDD